MFKNLEQIRAAHALESVGSIKKAAISGLPALVLSNGLLATLAFCESETSSENRGDMKKALLAATHHLRNRGLLGEATGPADSLRSAIDALCSKDSLHLQRVTEETLAYLGYLKRFASKPKDSSQS